MSRVHATCLCAAVVLVALAVGACGSNGMTTAQLDDVEVHLPDVDGAGAWVQTPILEGKNIRQSTIGTTNGVNDLEAPTVVVTRTSYNASLDREKPELARRISNLQTTPVELDLCSTSVWVNASDGFAVGVAVTDHSAPAGLSALVVPQGNALAPLLANAVEILRRSTGPTGAPMLACDDPTALVDAILNAEIKGIRVRDMSFETNTSAQPQREAGPQLSIAEVEQRAVAIDIELPVYEEDYIDGGIPQDLPMLDQSIGDAHSWIITVDLGSGQIRDWPAGYQSTVSLKVTDQGTYSLLDEQDDPVARLNGEYVPHGVVPGRWGDYVDLDIDADGVVTNWPAALSFSDFGQ